jgi:hypothetical protein
MTESRRPTEPVEDEKGNLADYDLSIVDEDGIDAGNRLDEAEREPIDGNR